MSRGFLPADQQQVYWLLWENVSTDYDLKVTEVNIGFFSSHICCEHSDRTGTVSKSGTILKDQLWKMPTKNQPTQTHHHVHCWSSCWWLVAPACQLKAVISQQYKIQKFNDQRSGFFNLKQGLNLTILLTTQKVCCYVFTYKGKVLTIKAAYNS